MVIFEIKTSEVKKAFLEIKKLLRVSNNWKLTTRVELTVLDGIVQIVGFGFIKKLESQTTGSCKLVVPIIHWYELAQTTTDPVFKVVVTDGEAMVGRVTVNVQTTFFETDKILRSINLPSNPKAIDYLKLAYQGYSDEELQFNALEDKVQEAKDQLDKAIAKVARELAPFRFGKMEIKDLILKKLSEREKIDLKL